MEIPREGCISNSCTSQPVIDCYKTNLKFDDTEKEKLEGKLKLLTTPNGDAKLFQMCLFFRLLDLTSVSNFI